MKFLKDMNSEFDFVNKIIKDFFGENLVSLVIFGSSCRKKKFKVVSDIDYIIIVEKSIKNQDIISRKLKKHLGDYFALLSFNIYDKKTFYNLIDNQDWLVLSIKLGYKVIFDKENFFVKEIEKRFKKIKSKKIAPLGWYIDKIIPDVRLIEHLLKLSDEYLSGSRELFKKKNFRLANLLLLNSIHCFLSALLLKRNIFITKGEISQCFIKNYKIGFNNLAKNLLEMEQICGQIEKISFNFNKDGQMVYINNINYLSNFYMNKYKIFLSLKKKFNSYGSKYSKKRSK